MRHRRTAMTPLTPCERISIAFWRTVAWAVSCAEVAVTAVIALVILLVYVRTLLYAFDRLFGGIR